VLYELKNLAVKQVREKILLSMEGI
jgi:hypothetical protein